MYYIRFFKVPKIIGLPGKRSISAVITITSDLGDEFYQIDTLLYLQLLAKYESHDTSYSEQLYSETQVRWKSGMHSLQVDMPIDETGAKVPLRLYVGSSPASSGNFNCIDLASNIQGSQEIETARLILINAWSDCMDLSKEKDQAQKFVERRLVLSSDGTKVLHLWEETGNSISRHIWDAGLMLLAILSEIKEAAETKQTSPKRLLTFQSQLEPCMQPSPHYERQAGSNSIMQHSDVMQPLILELGTGCGIVGIGLSAMCPESKIWLTDLPDVEDIVLRNKMQLPGAQMPKLQRERPLFDVNFDSVDWNEPVPHKFQGLPYSLILVADCMYNPDSHAALIHTLCRLIEGSQAVVLAAWKRRHPKEDVFWDMMAAAGFEAIKQEYIALPEAIYCDATCGVHVRLYRLTNRYAGLSKVSKTALN